MATAKRITDVGGTTTGYEYRDVAIAKQFFADGPSLFTWVISGFGPEGCTEHNTLNDAKAYIDNVKDN